VDSIAPTLGIRALKEMIEASRRDSDALALKFQTAQTTTEKAEIAREYDKALKRARAMQFLLELQERKEREAERQGLGT
jgi:hypothetical protein